MKTKTFINFVIDTSEAVRLECQNGYNRAEKELFIVDEEFYFFYAMNRNKRTQTISLREISKEEYYARKAELLNCRPANGAKEWTNGNSRYALKFFYYGTWKRSVPTDDCIFLSENKLKDLRDSVIAQLSLQQDEDLKLDREAKTEFARKCGYLSHKLDISFTNALRIGPDREKLREFKESYQQAILTAQASSLQEQNELLSLLNGGRKTRIKALDSLGIKYFDADINLMDFSELQQTLKAPLIAYGEESVKQAIQTALAMDPEQQRSVLENLQQNSRALKRETLRTLGVNVELIEFKHYPIDQIRKELMTSLGILST